MSDTTHAAAAPRRPYRLLALALSGALLLGGGSFYAVYAGLLRLPFGLEVVLAGAKEAEGGAPAAEAGPEGPAPAFVPLDTLVISLGPRAGADHLKVTLALDVVPGREEAVTAVAPRIADVLNTFLRAVETRTIEEPREMLRLRAQMLRRVQLVSPPGAVRDLLIQEFVVD